MLNAMNAAPPTTLIFAKTLVGSGMGPILEAPEPVRSSSGRAQDRHRRNRGRAVADRRDRLASGSSSSSKEGHPLNGKRLGCIIAVMTDVITAAPTVRNQQDLHPRKATRSARRRRSVRQQGIVRLSPR